MQLLLGLFQIDGAQPLLLLVVFEVQPLLVSLTFGVLLKLDAVEAPLRLQGRLDEGRRFHAVPRFLIFGSAGKIHGLYADGLASELGAPLLDRITNLERLLLKYLLFTFGWHDGHVLVTPNLNLRRLVNWTRWRIRQGLAGHCTGLSHLLLYLLVVKLYALIDPGRVVKIPPIDQRLNLYRLRLSLLDFNFRLLKEHFDFKNTRFRLQF